MPLGKENEIMRPWLWDFYSRSAILSNGTLLLRRAPQSANVDPGMRILICTNHAHRLLANNGEQPCHWERKMRSWDHDCETSTIPARDITLAPKLWFLDLPFSQMVPCCWEGPHSQQMISIKYCYPSITWHSICIFCELHSRISH
jgi:hypothetical protein